MNVVKSVAVRLAKRTDKLLDERDKKIAHLLTINRQLEGEQQKWRDKVEKVEHLRELEAAQLSMADTELEIVSGEMRQIYDILQSDMKQITGYLTRLEERKAAEDEEGSNQIYGALKSMSRLFGGMENEQRTTRDTLLNMREVIKAMTKAAKATTGTQVDESELLTQAGAIFSQEPEPNPIDVAEGSSLNQPAARGDHLIDELKLKEKNTPQEALVTRKHAEKPWVLTPTLLVFLENMSKDNEAGKVLPWEYTQQLIGEVYEARIEAETELSGGNMGFDEFVVVHFLMRHGMRRLAEVKLLEFIVSLKYYSRYWVRAEMFCQLMGVMRWIPVAPEPDPNYSYALDHNAQHFFFTVYRKIITFPQIYFEGGTYVPLNSVKKLARACLFFADEYTRSRILAKLEKDLRVEGSTDNCNFDLVLRLIVDEYLNSKKRISGQLNNAFSVKFEQNQGFFSLEEMRELFVELQHIYRSGESMQYGYPIRSQMQVAKLYLFSCTAGKNGYDFNANNFVQACQRYGFDAPFPFMHNCQKGKRKGDPYSDPELPSPEPVKPDLTNNRKPPRQAAALVSQKSESVIGKEGERAGQEASVGRERIDIGVKMFSQHFGILRELKTYVDIFTQTVKQEQDVEAVWKQMGQIGMVLDRGCQFLKFPLLEAAKK